MVATERSAGSRRFTFATSETGTRKWFAVAGEMLRCTMGCARSGCETVTVAVCVRARGGITTVKSPTETTPPRSPTTMLFVVVLDDPPRLRPSTWADAPPVLFVVEPCCIAACGAVGMLEQPATASKTAMDSARKCGGPTRRDIMTFSSKVAGPRCVLRGRRELGAASHPAGIASRVPALEPNRLASGTKLAHPQRSRCAWQGRAAGFLPGVALRSAR